MCIIDSPCRGPGKLSEVVHNALGDLTKAGFPGLALTLLPQLWAQAKERLKYTGSHSYVVYDDGAISQGWGRNV